MSMSNTKIPQIVFDNYVQEHWTKEETENVKVVIDFFVYKFLRLKKLLFALNMQRITRIFIA